MTDGIIASLACSKTLLPSLISSSSRSSIASDISYASSLWLSCNYLMDFVASCIQADTHSTNRLDDGRSASARKEGRIRGRLSHQAWSS